jgi:hypothetical protein
VPRKAEWVWAVLLPAIAAALPASATAQEGQILREHHAWGRFAAGAWKVVRLTTETFDGEGAVKHRSVTETRTTLTHADDEQFTLRIESTVEVVGKRIVAEPETVSQRYDGGGQGESVAVRGLGDDRVEIDGVSYTCQVREITVNGAGSRTVTKVYYRDDLPPFILRRASVATDLSTTDTTESTMEVLALDMPAMIVGEMKSTTHTKLVQRHAAGSSITLAVSSLEVPGGVVSYTSKDVDDEGRTIRRSTLELADYGVVVPEARPRRRRLFRRRRQVDDSTLAPTCPPDEAAVIAARP